MPWPTLFRRKKPTAAPSPEPSAVGAPAVVAQARTQARRRLIGAVVLLGIGVIAFPLLFETEPRPIPVDLPIVIPPKDGAPPLAMPAPVAASASASAVAAKLAPAPAPAPVEEIIESPAKAASPATAAVTRDAAPSVTAAAPARAETTPAKPSEPPAAAPMPAARDDGQRAQALLEGKVATTPAATASAARYAVQIGAFASDATVREVRGKAQKAGVPTFTQAVNVSSGQVTRVRVGPFAARAEADAAAAKLRKAGLPATVVKL